MSDVNDFYRAHENEKRGEYDRRQSDQAHAWTTILQYLLPRLTAHHLGNPPDRYMWVDTGDEVTVCWPLQWSGEEVRIVLLQDGGLATALGGYEGASSSSAGKLSSYHEPTAASLGHSKLGDLFTAVTGSMYIRESSEYSCYQPGNWDSLWAIEARARIPLPY